MQQQEVKDLTFTPQMRADLREFLDGYGEDTFGHYSANLDFSPQAIPDRHYYEAQGQEPPATEPEAARTLREVVTITLLLFMVGEFILLFAGL